MRSVFTAEQPVEYIETLKCSVCTARHRVGTQHVIQTFRLSTRTSCTREKQLVYHILQYLATFPTVPFHFKEIIL